MSDLLQRLRAATEGVTEGPWGTEAQGVYAKNGHQLVAHLKAHDGYRDWPTLERDRDFIAAARDLIPEAADRIAALEAEVARLREALEQAKLDHAEAFGAGWDAAKKDAT